MEVLNQLMLHGLHVQHQREGSIVASCRKGIVKMCQADLQMVI